MLALLILVALAVCAVWLLSWWKYTPTLYDDFDDATKSRALKIKFPKYTNLPRKCLVTGGSGFLGRHLVDALLEQGCNVTVFDLRKGFSDERVTFIEGNLVKKSDVLAACQGMEVVFHVASPAHDAPGPVLQKVNVDGTQTLVDCCIEAGVPRLVFTSSASVVFPGADQINANESTPYPATFRDVYSRTKAEAEQIALKGVAQSGGKLSVVSVRPHSLFGPRDPTLLPTLVKTAKAGKTKFAIGNGKTLSDFTYVGNVVQSHLLAAERATPKSPANGKPFFITNDAPIPFWGFMSTLLHGLGYTYPSRRLPYPVILALSHIVAGFLALLRPLKRIEVAFTPARMVLCGTEHWYDITEAKRDLGYTPLWPMAEALYLTLRSFTALRNPEAPTGTFTNTTDPWTVAEVAAHNKPDDAWLIIDGLVYDITHYIDVHPGGDKILGQVGGDASAAFHGPQHPSHVNETVKRFCIGRVVA